MNYKVLISSIAVTGVIIAVSISQVTGVSRSTDVSTERLMSVDMPVAAQASPPTAYEASQWSSLEQTEPVYDSVSRTAASAAVVPSIQTDAAIAPASADFGIGVPQIAYRFGYGFRVPAKSIKPLQDRHADQCENLGPTTCRILSMEQAESGETYSEGRLHLAIVAHRARDFGKALTSSAEASEGQLIPSSIDGEDLSKKIVDTEARLRARTVLRDRLMEVLRSRKGTVKELVEAERGVAAVNEEIDQARSWLTEMKGRVQYSQLQITYQAGAPIKSGFTQPVRDAWDSAGGTLGSMTAALLTMLTVLAPPGLILWLLFVICRRLGWIKPLQFGKSDETAEAAAA